MSNIIQPLGDDFSLQLSVSDDLQEFSIQSGFVSKVLPYKTIVQSFVQLERPDGKFETFTCAIQALYDKSETLSERVSAWVFNYEGASEINVQDGDYEDQPNDEYPLFLTWFQRDSKLSIDSEFGQMNWECNAWRHRINLNEQGLNLQKGKEYRAKAGYRIYSTMASQKPYHGQISDYFNLIF